MSAEEKKKNRTKKGRPVAICTHKGYKMAVKWQHKGKSKHIRTDLPRQIKRKKDKKKSQSDVEDQASLDASWDYTKNTDHHKVITDARFSSVHFDPRFERIPKQEAKVAIDSRFTRMFTEKNFSSSSAPVDKRGKVKSNQAQNPLLRYYYKEEGQEKGDGEGEKSWNGNVDSSSDRELSDLEALVDHYTSASESTSSSWTDEEEDTNEFYDWNGPSEKEDIPLINQGTRRLAVVNMDWTHVKAVDLFVLLSSFLTKDGQISSVAVYPSDFGLQRMEYEDKHGPAELFDSENDTDDEDSETANEKLRAYEKSRLRYYYAIVECDSDTTADHIYKACDGAEFERTSNMLDLRFVPDSMEFKHLPRDVATEAPASYHGLNFHTSALQQSKIHLSWDDDEPERKKIMKWKFDSKQLDEQEFKQFLASSSDETDEDSSEREGSKAMHDGERTQKTDKLDLYRTLLQNGSGSDSDHNTGKDMEVTFNTGLEDISKKMLDKDRNSETVWEAYLRKRMEKRKARRGSNIYLDEEDGDSDKEVPSDADMDDFFAEELSVMDAEDGNKYKKSKRSSLEVTKGKMGQGVGEKRSVGIGKEAAASRAELELLLAGEEGAHGSVKGYKIKTKKGKSRKGQEVISDNKLPSVDLDDPRFSALLTNPLFSVDPTDPQFKRSAAYARHLLQQQQQDREKREVMPTESEPRKEDELPVEGSFIKKDELLDVGYKSSNKEKLKLSSLVRSVKRKIGALKAES